MKFVFPAVVVGVFLANAISPWNYGLMIGMGLFAATAALLFSSLS